MLQDIHFEDPASLARSLDIEKAKVLVRALLASLEGIVDQDLIAVTLAPLAGGRAAHVFRLNPLFEAAGSPPGMPLVVKIVSLADGLAEQANYDRYVRPFLPAAYRPELLGFATTGDQAALCYSFVGTGVSSTTLTEFLARGELKSVDCLLHGVFDRWYDGRIIHQESDLARRYLDRFFIERCKAAAAEATLSACANMCFGARPENGGYIVDGTWLPSPHAVLFATGRELPYSSCIIHGDLNSDNIVFADGGLVPTLVDFRETGRGHIFEDLVSLELSVRINYPATASWADIFETERRIAAGEWHQSSYATAIGGIRDAAARYFGQLEDRTYHYAAAAIGLRVLMIPELSDAARARVTASTLHAARSLALMT